LVIVWCEDRLRYFVTSASSVPYQSLLSSHLSWPHIHTYARAGTFWCSSRSSVRIFRGITFRLTDELEVFGISVPPHSSVPICRGITFRARTCPAPSCSLTDCYLIFVPFWLVYRTAGTTRICKVGFHTHTQTYTHTRVRTHAHTHSHMHSYVYTSHTCIYIYIYPVTRTHTYTEDPHAHTYTHAHTTHIPSIPEHTHTLINIFTHVHKCTHTPLHHNSLTRVDRIGHHPPTHTNPRTRINSYRSPPADTNTHLHGHSHTPHLQTHTCATSECYAHIRYKHTEARVHVRIRA